jgi:hypothetical protein
MNILGDLTRADLDAGNVFFNKDEVFEFTIIDFMLNAQTMQITLKAQVETGENTGKKLTIFIPDTKTDLNRKKRAEFFFQSGFWTDDELKTDFKLARMMGARMSGKADAKRDVPMKDDPTNIKSFQDIRHLKVVRLASAVDADASPAAAAASSTSF